MRKPRVPKKWEGPWQAALPVSNLRIQLLRAQTWQSQAHRNAAPGTVPVSGRHEGLLGISPVTVLNWVRQWGKAIQRLRKKQKPVKVEEVEIDELCTFVAQKKLVVGGGGCG